MFQVLPAASGYRTLVGWKSAYLASTFNDGCQILHALWNKFNGWLVSTFRKKPKLNSMTSLILHFRFIDLLIWKPVCTGMRYKRSHGFCFSYICKIIKSGINLLCNQVKPSSFFKRTQNILHFVAITKKK